MLSEDAPLQLRGVQQVGDVVLFGIFAEETQKSEWVALNEAGNPYTVRTHEVVDGSDQVTVDYRGSTLTLGLKSPRVSAATGGARGGRGAVATLRPANAPQGAVQIGIQNGNQGNAGARGGRGGRGGGNAGDGQPQASAIAPDQAASILAGAAAARNQRAIAIQQGAATPPATDQPAAGRRGRGGQ